MISLKKNILFKICRRIRANLGQLFNYLMKYWILISCKFLKPLYFLIYLFYKRKKIVFAINSMPGVGHIFPELDYLFRILHLRNIDPKNCIVFCYPGDLSKAISILYSSLFFQVVFTRLRFGFLLPVPLLFPSISIDIGHSRLKWNLKDPLKRKLRRIPCLQALSQLPNTKLGIDQYNHYYQIRNETEGLLFLEIRKQNSFYIKKIQELLSLHNRDKICLIHLKQNIANATAKITDPSTYFKSLLWLKDKGYKFVFVGREKMPKAFISFGIIDYANSPFVSFEYDIALFHLASLAILAGSGISYLADCLGVPFLYINSWHIANVPYSFYSMNIPALVKDLENNSFLSIQKQIDLFENNTRESDELDVRKYEAINATSEDILSGIIELTRPIHSPSPLQIAFHKKFSKFGYMQNSKSRFSNTFLKKHQNLFLKPNEHLALTKNHRSKVQT